MSTAFSGIGAAESASLSLQSAAHKFVVEKTGFKKPLRNVRLGSSCEVSTTCQTVLAQTYNHCNYPDIMDIQLGATCGNYCSTHGKFCKPQKKTNTRINVNCAGPVCVAFSLMGRRRKEQDISFRTHEKYYQEYGKSNSVLIVENVTEYSEEIVAARLGPSWRIQATRLDPRIFGMGVSRPRLYMICYDSDHVRWDADFTLNEFVTALAAKPVLTARDYFWEKVPKKRLTNAEEQNLMAYRALDSKRYNIVDVTQYAKNGRPRGQLKDGSLMTLTTNCGKFFSEDHGRVMAPKELLTAQTLPTTDRQSETCGAPKLNLQKINSTAIPKLAGNSMSAPCVGCVLLAAVCAIKANR